MTLVARCLLLWGLCWSLFFPAAGCNRALSADAGSSHAAAKLPPPPTTQESIAYLASDELEGRGVGTPGLDRAADYIARQFEHSGLKPLPALSGYFQRFEMTTGASVTPDTTLSLNGKRLILNETFRPLGFSASGRFDAAVAFVGYGIASEKYKFDDYAGLDVKGKVVLAMRFEPHNDAGKSRFVEKSYSEEATFKRKAQVAAERGAAALLVVNPPEHHGKDGLVPFAGMFTESKASIPIVQVSVESANALLSAGGAPNLKTLQTKIDTSGKPASRLLDGVRAAGDVRIVHNRANVANVVGLVPGRGELADEYVVVGAHYDHVGKSRMFSAGAKEGEIHNGADDNASGTTAMLTLAREFATRSANKQEPPTRSILFVAFTAEEWGLIGSQHFVDHSPVPLPKVAAMINMDMVGRVRNETIYLGGTGTAKGFEAVIRAADEASPLEVKDIGKGGFGPSDHMSFALKKIPVLFFFSGLHPDYHRPSDDVEKVNFAGIGEVVAMARRIVDALATGPREEYVAVAEARSAHGMTIGDTGGTGGRRVTLGVVPDYTSAESSSGVRISGTTPGSPAEAAGLQDGDVITRFGEKPIGDLYELTAALGDASPGDKVKLKVLRGEKTLELDATLAERKE